MLARLQYGGRARQLEAADEELARYVRHQRHPTVADCVYPCINHRDHRCYVLHPCLGVTVTLGSLARLAMLRP